jgi:hypothetical protein
MLITYRTLVHNFLGKFRFVDNLPGHFFVKGFLKRHARLTVRTANLIKRSRAALSHEEVNNFFDRFELTAAGIPPENMFNCDETNLQENPGAVKAIFSKGVKYAEQVRDFTKTAISVMFCGSAAGVLLPPYVVYKGANVYESWSTGGPKGTVYNSSASGWFDTFIFEDWFKKVFLPHTRRLPGKKLLVCDNLSSHLSVSVIQQCREEDIEFVCLPPNSTDKIQPLDVGLFGPMKSAWRKQLRSYSDKDPSAKLLQKSEFPKMLKELVQSLNPKEHLPNAFEKCGLCPLNRTKVIERIPTVLKAQEIARHIDAALIKKLEVRRFGEGKKRPRGKKVPAGTSYTAVEESSEESSEEEQEESTEEQEESSEEEQVESSVEEQVESSVEDEGQREEVEDNLEKDMEEELPDLDQPAYVVAVYEGQWFAAEVSKNQSGVAKGYTRLSYLVIKGSNSFTWGPRADLHVTLDEDILLRNVVLEPVNSRGHLGLKKSDLKIVLARMVVVIYLPTRRSNFKSGILKYFLVVFRC